MKPSLADPTALPLHKSCVVSRTPFYYGWVVLLAATFGMLMTTPGQTLGVSIFLDRIMADLGLSRATVSLLYTVGTLAGSFSLPFIGRFIDRRGSRTAVIVISALFALACVWMGFVGSAVALLVGFILIRGLGQGALGLVSLHVINLWFVRRRGLAVGLSGLGMALATALFPFVIEALIGAFGWRLAYVVLGGLVAVTILPLGAWLYRGRPELYGLEPDGARRGADRYPRSETILWCRRAGPALFGFSPLATFSSPPSVPALSFITTTSWRLAASTVWRRRRSSYLLGLSPPERTY